MSRVPNDVQHTTQFWSGAGLAAAFATLSLACAVARAGAITVSEGDTVVFTFDFTGLSAAQPPYPDVRVHTGIDLDSVDPGSDRCRFTLYRDGGGVSPDSSIVACGIGTFEGGSEESGWLDGVLSIAVTVLSGSITLDPHAMAFTAFGPGGVPLTPLLDPRLRIIDEPAQGALLLALAGLAVRTGRVRVRSRVS